MNSRQVGYEFLDPFSTSQGFDTVLSDKLQTCAALECENNAPFFAYFRHDKTYGVTQGCCNSWNCKRCGLMRAKQEYGRIVEGCRTLAIEGDIYFVTITCRGREMSKSESENGYLSWTNKLLTRWRDNATRNSKRWHYVQVTERQKRGHPHSHILTTWSPPEQLAGVKGKWQTLPNGRKIWVEKDTIFSDYIRRTCIGVGLGEQYDLSVVQSAEAASRYVAKYLFKKDIFETKWPTGWRRVRYSQSFPKLTKRQTNAFVLKQREDWLKLGSLAANVTVDSSVTKEMVHFHLNYLSHFGVNIK